MIKRYFVTLFLLLLVIFTITPLQAGSTIQTIDATENSGYANQLVMTSDGHPVMAYRNIQSPSSPELRLAICNDASCSAPVVKSIKTGISSALGGLAITADDRPVMSVSGFEGIQLQVCDTAACTTHTQVVVDAASQGNSAVQINSSGQPVVAYRKLISNVLALAVCNDLACASPTLRALNEPSTTDSVKMVLYNDKPVIAYLTANSSASLKILVCSDATCSSFTTNTLDGSGAISARFDLAVNASGFPFVTYWHSTNLDLMLARCSTTTCDSGTVTTSIADGGNGLFGGFASSIQINASGNPVIAYTMNTSGIWLKLMRCNDPQCSSATNPPDYTFVDWSPTKAFYSGESPSLQLSGGNPIIAFGRDNDITNANQLDLMLGICNDARCYDPTFTSTPASGSTVLIQAAAGNQGKSCIIMGNRGEDGAGLNVMLDSISTGYSITFPLALPVLGVLEPNIGLNGSAQYSNDFCLQVACIVPQDAGTLTIHTNEDGNPTYNYNLECAAPTPTATATATSTNTDLPATATATPTVTSTSGGGSTATPTATSTSGGGSTATPTPTSTSGGGSTATPTATNLPGINLIDNSGMESDDNGDKIPDQWTLAKESGDKQKCNKPDKPVSHGGECAFVFKGGAGELAKLQQKPDIAGLSFSAGDTLTLRVFTRAASSASSSKVKVIVKYNGGTAASKIKLNLVQSADYALLTGSTSLTSDKVLAIKVMIKNQSPSGKVFVDDATLMWEVAQGRLLALPGQ